MSNRKNWLLYSMVINWIIMIIIGVIMGVVLRDLRGIEWFGSPLLACILMGLSMTILYFTTKHKEWKLTEIILFWFAALFIVNIINMTTLAYCILGNWEDFQAMPIMGTFQLLIVALAVHFMMQYMRRRALNQFTLWTTVFFFITLSSMVFLALSLFEGWDDWQQMPIVGIGIWTVLMYIIYLTPKGEQMLILHVFFYWAWFMFVGITTSMIAVYIQLLSDKTEIWPLYPSIGTLGIAIVATVLLIVFRTKKDILPEKLVTQEE